MVTDIYGIKSISCLICNHLILSSFHDTGVDEMQRIHIVYVGMHICLVINAGCSVDITLIGLGDIRNV